MDNSESEVSFSEESSAVVKESDAPAASREEAAEEEEFTEEGEMEEREEEEEEEEEAGDGAIGSESELEPENDLSFERRKKHSRKKQMKRKLRKKETQQRRKDLASYFIDREAAESEEDDTYDETLSEAFDDIDELKRLQKYNKEKSREDRGLLPVRGTGHFASTVKKLEQRFEGGEDEAAGSFLEPAEEEEEEDKEEDPELANLLPNMTDPKLWMVKLFKVGKEREAVIQIQNKHFKLQQQGKDLGIISCYAAQTLQGYIYVEATTEFRVKEALRGFRNLSLTGDIKMVPLKEMPSVFAMGERDRYVPRPYDYVRVKSGLYGGDLGQIVSLDDEGAAVIIKLIPRVDLELLIEMDQNGKRSVYDREILRKGGERPMKKFLDRDEVDAKGYRVEQGQPQRTIRLAGSTFDEAGYIFKRFSLNRLLTGGSVNPQLAELKEFENSRSKLDEELASQARIIRPTKQQLHLYRNGERVKIIGGDLMNIECVIIHVDEDGLDVQPDNKSLQPFKIAYSQVSKIFIVGNCVKAISGLNAGDSGMITHIDNEKRVATVFSFASRQQFESSLDFLTVAPIEGYGRDGLQQIGGYALGDLVTLPTCVGVLCFINKKHIVNVLTEEDEWVTANASEIGSKLSSLDQIAVDSNRAAFKIKTRVQIIQGIYKGLCGFVQHIRKNYAFVKVANRLENGGYIAVPASYCVASGGGNERSGEHPQTAVVKQTDRPGIRSGGRRPFRGGRGRGRRDALIGKQVKIVNNKKFKGRIATVRSVDDDIIQVLIESTNFMARLPRSNIVVEDNIVTSSRNFGTVGGSYFGRAFLNSHRLDNNTAPSTPSTSTIWEKQIGNSRPPSRGEVLPSHPSSKRSRSEDSVMDLGDPNDDVTTAMQQSDEMATFDIDKDTVPLPAQLKLPHWCYRGVRVDIVAEGNYLNKVGAIKKCVARRNNVMKFLCIVIVEDDEVLFDPEALHPCHPSVPNVDKVWAWNSETQSYCTGVYEGMKFDRLYVKLFNGAHILSENSTTFKWDEISDDES